MDQSLVDVTALRGRVKVGDEVVIVGQQGQATVTVDELADKLGMYMTKWSPRSPTVCPGSPLAPLTLRHNYAAGWQSPRTRKA